MTKLIAQQPLVAVHIGVKTKRSKGSATLREEILDAAGDQNTNQMIVKGPSGLVAACDGEPDEANGIVDHTRPRPRAGAQSGSRAATSVISGSASIVGPTLEGVQCGIGQPHTLHSLGLEDLP